MLATGDHRESIPSAPSQIMPGALNPATEARRRPAFVALPLAVVGALLISGAGGLAWTVLIGFNLKHRSDLPWAVPAMLAVIGLVCAWGQGWGPPQGSSKVRRSLSGLAWPRSRDWPLAAPAAGLTAVSILCVWFAALRLGGFSAAEFQAPAATGPLDAGIVAVGLAMTAFVAAVFEETAYRGVLQSTFQRRVGPALAITVSSIVFYLVHLRYGWAAGELPKAVASGVALIWAGVAFGILTWCARSVWPAIFAHALTDVVSLSAEWRLGWTYDLDPVPSGGDPRFLLVCGVGAASFGALLLIWRRLARRARSEPPTAGNQTLRRSV